MRVSKIVIILLSFVLLRVEYALASFGDSCSVLPISPTDNYLRMNTAYGHIIGNIDMKAQPGAGNTVDPCDATDPDFRFCLKDATGIAPYCTQVILREGDTRKLMDITTNPDLLSNESIKEILLTVSWINSNLCLTMPTSRGPMPIICKSTTLASTQPDDTIPKCSTIGDSCYTGHNRSQSMLNFSGLAVHCLKETLDKVFYEKRHCIPDAGHDENIEFTALTPFPAFQEAMKASIRAAFIIYVIFYGLNVLMNHEYVELNKVAGFIIKFILIAYFAVGLGPVYFQDGKATTKNGMVEIALPFLAQVTSDMAQMVFSAGGSKGLCEFDLRKYDHGYAFYGVWDAIDCRIGYYLGMQLFYNMTSMTNDLVGSIGSSPPDGSPINLGSSGGDPIKSLKVPGGFAFLMVLFGFLMGGNIIIFICGLVFAIFFISIVLYFITSYLVCLVTLYSMAYISPIFITMALFERTKSYFDSWLKVTLSCALQPAIIAGFIALLLTMYDSAIYKSCEFRRHDYTLGTINFSTFELQEPSGHPEDCRSSAGYKLLKYYTGQGWEKESMILFPLYSIRDTFEIIYEMLYVFVFTVIFYFFSKSISQFASDITSGPAMDAVTASPTKVVDGAMKAAAYLQDYKKAGQDALKSAKETGEKPGEKGGGEGGGAKDSMGGGGEGGGATDSMGGGGGGSIPTG